MALLHHRCFSSLPIRASFNSTKQACIGRPISLATFRNRNVASCPVQCVANAEVVSAGKNITRRSANYQLPIWHFDYVESLKIEYTIEKYAGIIEDLKQEVRVMLKKMENNPLALLEHIDVLQRLGLSYHFENEVKIALKGIFESRTNELCDDTWKRNNLYATALEFRLLRQHGFLIPQEIFNAFKDPETGGFRACMSDDISGILSLYEASFHVRKEEDILDEARDFSTRCLEKYLKKEKDHENNELALLVSHALETPLHWKVPRLEARWFIEVYERRDNKNPTLLKLAKLDFNVVQSKLQEDMKDVSRWWKNTGLGQNLKFNFRDRLVVTFLWSVGMVFEPQFGYSRKVITEVISLINVVDDIYDVYGTVDELELFTDAVERWNTCDIDHLPEYMKIAFVALHNSINELAFDVLKKQRLHVIKYLKKAWTGLCKAYLQEAKWYYSGYTPTLQEYIENAWISISAPTVLVHAFFSVANPITEEAMGFLEEYPSLIQQSSMLLRLPDDLGTSPDEIKRGDNPKSVQCYMHEAGVSEDEAREHVKFLISETWKQLNEDRFAKSPFTKPFIEIATNLGRMAQCMYLYGDGHGVEDRETKDLVESLLINPIPLGY